MTRYRHLWMALVYLLMAALPAYQTINHTNIEIEYLKEAYKINNFQNNGAIKEAAFWKQVTSKHHVVGHFVKDIFAPAINQQFKIPPEKDAQDALDKVPGLIQQGKDESATALFWSLLLLGLSLVYFAVTMFARDKAGPDPIFALAIISVLFLVVGVLAPAMVIIVSPATDVFPHFILHFQIRSIFGVISELYLTRYWIVAVCLTVFSILIPLAKAGLTVFVLESASLTRKLKISKFLHSISKWSMADVFVAAILLSNFAVRANKSTQADLFVGFYYFSGYCLLSMVATTLLHEKVQGAAETPGRRRRPPSKKALAPSGAPL
jgi:paraquat-inducible protein A